MRLNLEKLKKLDRYIKKLDKQRDPYVMIHIPDTYNKKIKNK